MATCKDCIHFEACERMMHDTNKMFKALLSEALKMNCDFKYDSTNTLSGAEICQCFQAHSNFVELPCKIGDTLYTIVTGNRIREWIVVDISFFSYSVVKIVITADSKDNNGTDHMRFEKHYLNHSVFLSREAAEQALKEREG